MQSTPGRKLCVYFHSCVSIYILCDQCAEITAIYPTEIGSPDFVEGFGREWAHSGTAAEPSVPLVSCNCLFISHSGVFARDELPEEERLKALQILAVYCGATKSFAHAVPQKGVDPDGYVVEQLKSDVLWMGHPR